MLAPHEWKKDIHFLCIDWRELVYGYSNWSCVMANIFMEFSRHCILIKLC